MISKTKIVTTMEMMEMTDMSDKKRLLEDALATVMSGCPKQSDGYHEEIYLDRDDVMEGNTAIEILDADDPIGTLYDVLFSCYVGTEARIEFEIFKKVRQMILDENPGLEIDEDEIKQYVESNVIVDYPMDHYLNQKFPVNIFMDTGDGNYDYVLNCAYPHYNGRPCDLIDKKASLCWLTYQQGYNKADLNRALKYQKYGESDYLKSVRQEVLNHTSHMGVLTFLVQMSLRELIILNGLLKLQDRNGHNYDNTKNPYCGLITVSKNTECGLFDPWQGGGSLFEIELEKDVTIPIRFIRSATVDGGDGYSVRNVYGCDDGIYGNDDVKIVIPKKERSKYVF